MRSVVRPSRGEARDVVVLEYSVPQGVAEFISNTPAKQSKQNLTVPMLILERSRYSLDPGAHVNISGLKGLRKDACDVNILQEEVMRLVGHGVQLLRHAGGHGVGRAAAVRWKCVVLVVIARHNPLTVTVVTLATHWGHLVHPTHEARIRMVLEGTHQRKRVDEHVLVTLEEPGGVRTVREGPVQHGEGLQRQVTVGVHEVHLGENGDQQLV